jgi:mRNA-degrading endonuclease RelE of RelBE toxin-antitoxin system
MIRSGQLISSIMFAIFTIGILSAQTQKEAVKIEGSSFCADESEDFQSARPPTNVVLDVLLKTPGAKDVSAELEKLDREEQRKLFRAVRVHLSETDPTDYLVVGSYPMSGADNDWFWLVRQTQNRAQVILDAGGNCLDLLRTRSSGYRDIRTVWSAASGLTITRIYHYDGNRYQLVHRYTKTVGLSQ